MPYPDAVLKWSIRAYVAVFLGYLLFPLAYLMLLADQYPPFGDAPYPAHT